MSRAFVKEDIEMPERSELRRSPSGLPPGAMNLMTADGARELRERLATLPQSEADERGRLEEILASATIVEPLQAPPGAIVFGSRVTLRNAANEVRTFRIVGVDETDLQTENLSWIGPCGRALLAAKPGQTVRVTPEGPIMGTVVSVE